MKTIGLVGRCLRELGLPASASGLCTKSLWERSLTAIVTGSSVTIYGNYNGGGMTGSGDKYFAADLNPGFSPAAVTVEGNVTLLASAKLNIELGGTTLGSQFDHVAIANALMLGGTLSIALINDFTPAVGDTFDILDWGTLAGEFSSLELPTLASGLTWNISQLYTSGVLSVMAGIAGDFNNDGVVDAGDYVVWRKGLGTIYTQADYQVWRTNFGETAGIGSGPATKTQVPEPTGVVIFVTTMAAMGCCRRMFLDKSSYKSCN